MDRKCQKTTYTKLLRFTHSAGSKTCLHSLFSAFEYYFVFYSFSKPAGRPVENSSFFFCDVVSFLFYRFFSMMFLRGWFLDSCFWKIKTFNMVMVSPFFYYYLFLTVCKKGKKQNNTENQQTPSPRILTDY